MTTETLSPPAEDPPPPRTPPAADCAISVTGLVKRYDNATAIAGIDLDVHRGEVFAFLGPNGAGKTTTVEVLEGFRRPNDGRVCVLGTDPARAGRAWRDRVGVVLQESEPEPGLTVRQCLRLYAGYYTTPRDVDDTVALVGLEDRASRLCAQLSGGERRRLDVALALIGDPELIFLDEPTTGFDPSARRAAWDVIAGLRDLGKTVFLTTHYMDEAEYLADRIAVIVAGRIVAEGTPRALGGRDRMAARVRFTLPAGLTTADLPGNLRPLAEAVPSRRDTHGDHPAHRQEILLRTESPLIHVQALADWALGTGFDLPDLDVRRSTLEEVYLDLTESRKDPS